MIGLSLHFRLDEPFRQDLADRRRRGLGVLQHRLRVFGPTSHGSLGGSAQPARKPTMQGTTLSITNARVGSDCLRLTLSLPVSYPRLSMEDQVGPASPDQLLRDLVDFVLPLLPPYELSIYLVLLRRSHLEGGQATVCIGKRSIVVALGKMSRSTSNMQHVTEKIAILASRGFVSVGPTDRLGTRYEVALPHQVPAVKELVAMTKSPPTPALDHYHDAALRRSIYERDAWLCRYCGEQVTEITGTLDHVVPVSKAGENTAENLATCCLMCNSIKAGRTYEEAAPQILARLVERRTSTEPRGG